VPVDRPGFADGPLKWRVWAALDTIRQFVEMLEAAGLEPVTEIAEMLARHSRSKNSERGSAPQFAPIPSAKLGSGRGFVYFSQSESCGAFDL
jgi:hypothetical protein